MDFQLLPDWHAFLPRAGGHVVSLMGSGGKTALMRAIASQYVAESVAVLLTTTTRSEVLDWVPDLNHEELEEGEPPACCFVHRGKYDDGKWRGLTPRQVDRLAERYPRRVILAEVDGAAKHPLKLHRSDEPIWPGRTSLGIVVMGTAALADTAGSAIHRFERLGPGPLEETTADTSLDWDHFFALLTGPGGYLERTPAAVPLVLALTQISDLADAIGLFDFAARVMTEPRLPLLMFCELDPERFSLRTAARSDEDGVDGEDKEDCR